LKCDGARAETRFRLSAKRTSPFKSAGASVQSTTGSRGVRISGSNAGYTKFRGSVKTTGYPLHSPVSPSLPLPCVTVCHHVSTGLYQYSTRKAQKADDATCRAHRKSNRMKKWVRQHRNLASSLSLGQVQQPSSDVPSIQTIETWAMFVAWIRPELCNDYLHTGTVSSQTKEANRLSSRLTL
jgi:hypothetical protein